MYDPDAVAAQMGKKAKHRPGIRRNSTGTMGVTPMGLEAAECALAAGDLNMAASIAGTLREKESSGGGAAAKQAKARAEAEARKQKEFLRFQKEVAIQGIRKGDMRRRNSLPNILAQLGEDQPRARTGGGPSVTSQRHQAIEMTRADKADIPWHKLPSDAKDEHGRRMSASLQAIHRRNSYNAIPMSDVKVSVKYNPCELPTEGDAVFGGRKSIHS